MERRSERERREDWKTIREALEKERKRGQREGNEMEGMANSGNGGEGQRDDSGKDRKRKGDNIGGKEGRKVRNGEKIKN